MSPIVSPDPSARGDDAFHVTQKFAMKSALFGKQAQDNAPEGCIAKALRLRAGEHLSSHEVIV